jgi:hypothetical protein
MELIFYLVPFYAFFNTCVMGIHNVLNFFKLYGEMVTLLGIYNVAIGVSSIE